MVDAVANRVGRRWRRAGRTFHVFATPVRVIGISIVATGLIAAAISWGMGWTGIMIGALVTVVAGLLAAWGVPLLFASFSFLTPWEPKSAAPGLRVTPVPTRCVYAMPTEDSLRRGMTTASAWASMDAENESRKLITITGATADFVIDGTVQHVAHLNVNEHDRNDTSPLGQSRFLRGIPLNLDPSRKPVRLSCSCNLLNGVYPGSEVRAKVTLTDRDGRRIPAGDITFHEQVRGAS
jgi:hypothetical protein